MSALAHIFSGYGYKISGSDIEINNITKALQRKKIDVKIGHNSSNITDQDLVVYSSCIKENNPEIIAARSKRIPIMPRIELLQELMKLHKKTIGIAGTHGKTTITAMAALLTENAGLSPTLLIGGESPHFKGNVKLGKRNLLVSEVDESDGRFILLRPSHIVISNIEYEHPERYKNEGMLVDTFRHFLTKQSKSTAVFYRYEDKNLQDLIAGYKGKSFSFGFSNKADLYADNLNMDGNKISFDCFFKKKPIGKFTINIPGIHNVLNALAVVALGLELHINIGIIKKSLSMYKGVKRRFEIVGHVNGAKVVEDYAHHPTEIKATIQAAYSLRPKRIITVFQPHRYTRTKAFCMDFSRSFNGSSEVILTDIYSASENKLKGISTKSIYDLMAKQQSIPVKLMNKEEIAPYLLRTARKGDIVLILGAGDVGSIAKELVGHSSGISEIGGSVLFNERLSKHTTFRIGGPCKVWIEPKNEKELKKILKITSEKKEKILIMGLGSNMLIKDKGFNGAVINLGSKFFKKVRIKGTSVFAGAGVKLASLIERCYEKSLEGLEELVGIPSTVGGAVFMNASYMRTTSDFIKSVRVMNKNDGTIKVLKRKDIKFEYRHSDLDVFIILEVEFSLEKANKKFLLEKKKRLLAHKRITQPIGSFSAGCIFKNPKGEISAAKYIDMLGLKGKKKGKAEISKKHANFIINRKNAKAEDVLHLMDVIKKRVKGKFGKTLIPEVKVI